MTDNLPAETIVVYDQEYRESSAIVRLGKGEWRAVHAAVGEDAENFIAYQQAQQQKRPKCKQSQTQERLIKQTADQSQAEAGLRRYLCAV